MPLWEMAAWGGSPPASSIRSPACDMPGYGYGINYEFGLFRQEIEDGRQKERPDYWASAQSPWLIEHQDQAYVIPVYGRVEHGQDRSGKYNPMWLDWKVLIGVPHDLPVVGYDGRTVNTLRLFSARASDEFDIKIFNDGDYMSAVEQKMASETVSKVLYPSDAIDSGRYLRLTQEYFLVACSIRDIFRRFLMQHSDPRKLADYVAIQMNDTHPALTVAELMRTLDRRVCHRVGGSLADHASLLRLYESHADAGSPGTLAGKNV